MRLPLYTWIILLILALTGGVVTHLLGKETPYGRLMGTLRTAESGRVLARVPVTVSPVDNSEKSYRTVTDREGRFRFSRLPVGAYRLFVETQAHAQPEETIGIREGETTEAAFELRPTDPFLRVFQRQRIFTTREAPTLRCHGFAPVGALTVRVYRITGLAGLKSWHGWLPGALNLHGENLESVDLSRVPELTLAKTLSHAVSNRDRDGEGVFRTEISPGKLPPGMYLVAVEAERLRALAPVAVTDLGLIVKSSPTQALVYAVNIATGTAAPNVALRVLRDDKDVATGATDASGLATLALPRSDGGDEMMVVGSLGESVAVAGFYRYWSDEQQNLRIYTYTDRPVYRPGHTVYFKSILRELKGDSYSVPGAREATIRVTDGQDNLIYRGMATSNRLGSLNGEFVLPEEALPGQYQLAVNTDGGHDEFYFSVAEYRKPEFEVEVTTPRDRYHGGESIPATIAAHYYYGAPVPGAEVDYYVTRSQYWYYDEGEAAWDDDLAADYEGDGEGEYLLSGTGKLNDAGELKIIIPPRAEDASSDDGTDWRYTVMATVTDASQRAVEGQRGVLVTQGAFRLEASAEDWVTQPGESTTMQIRAVDYDGKPVAGVHGSATFARAEWDNGKETLRQPRDFTWQTDADGRAAVRVTPSQAGDYRLRVRAKDRESNLITGTAYLWVMSGDYAAFDYPYQDIDVRADRKLYKEGDTAQIVVNTRYAPTTALLTIEGDRLYQRTLVTLKDKSTILNVKVRPEFLPSVRAGVCFLRGKQFYSGEAAINVSREKKALDVAITTDKPRYLPGGKAVYHVKTRTPEGTPVAAEVSLGLVDEAIYGIEPEGAPNIVSYFYPKREQQVQTVFSFPEVYLSGDNKGGSTIRTRRRFLDTAVWRPTLLTDAKGEGTLEVTLPDNLTTWRATCRAMTAETRVGQATAKTVVSKPFLMRLEPPRFFTQGDTVTIAAVAHNLSGKAVSARLGLNVDGVTLKNGREQTLRLADGKTGRVTWKVAAAALGTAKLRAWADAGGGLEDAMELTLPVLPCGRTVEDSAQGVVTAQTDISLALREDVIPGTQRLTLRLSPSLASAMLGSLDYLAQYPYGCVEQTLSSFLPDVVIWRMLKRLEIDNPALEKTLPKMVEAGLLKLYGFQHEDGGWGWWSYDESTPWMTAYVVLGLAQAREAGFTVNDRALANGVAALQRYAREGRLTEDERAFAAYALAEAGQTGTAGTLADYFAGQQGPGRLARTGAWSQLMLAQALLLLGRDDAARPLVAEGWRRYAAQVDDDGPWWSRTDIAGALLAAASRLDAGDPRIQDLIQELMRERQGNHWYSTRDTAFILYGLTRYLESAHELDPDLRLTVQAGNRTVLTRHFTRADVFNPEFTLQLTAKELPVDERLPLTLRAEGQGRLYYTAALTQSVETKPGITVQNSEPLVVERTYRKVNRTVAHGQIAGKRGQPQTRFDTGDAIEVTLTVRSQKHYDYLMLEDPLPAGCEVQERGTLSRWEWSDWWCAQIARDEQVGFALRELEPGARTITYYLTALVPGRYLALPPRVYDMYRPSRCGWGVAQAVEIRE